MSEIALWLLQKRVDGGDGEMACMLRRKCHIYRPSLVASVSATYSALVPDSAVKDCCQLFQEIGPSWNVNRYPLMEQRSGCDPQSLSL